MPSGGSIINTASVNADQPKPKLIAYSATKAAIVNFSGSLAALLAEKGIRANAVAPRPDLDAADPVDDAAGTGGKLAVKCRCNAWDSLPSWRPLM